MLVAQLVGTNEDMKKTARPLLLTVNGKGKEVFLDAVASVRRGLAQTRKSAGRLADELFDELEQEDSIP
jgi:hypothetical protein